MKDDVKDREHNIHLWGVKQNNLKNIEVKIPVGSMTVICGPSGSGKSSLAFETLFAEGQRRFIESMSNYARQFLNKAPKPDIEGINNIPPAISIEQKNTIKSSRSTVGTTTEIIDYLRLLYEKIGRSYCPTHHCLTEKESVTEATDKVIKNFSGKRGYLLVEISAEGRVAEGKKLHSLLLQDGYLRIYIPKVSEPVKSSSKAAKKTAGKKATKKVAAVEMPTPVVGMGSGTGVGGVTSEDMGTVVEIGDAAAIKKGLPKESFYLVIDRMSFNEEERGRIADSMTQAYEASIKYNTNFISRKATVLTTEGQRLQISEESSCPVCGYTPPALSSKLFSFNSPIGACPTCKGFGNILDIDEEKVIPNPNMSLAQGALSPFWMPSAAHEKKQLLAYCKKAKIDTHTPWKELPKDHRDVIWNGNKDFFGVRGLFEYLDQIKYKMHVRVFISRFRSPFICPTCKGARLRVEANHVLIDNSNINQLSNMTIEDLHQFFQKLQLAPHQLEVANEVLKQIRARLEFLMRVGVHYLSLGRETRTLSGGEYQRLILANQLGMGLSQALYVLDEPTVGLHPRDNDRLISILKDLKELGNTLVIVEHDHDVIKASENIIEMGPGSGYLGGQVVYSGTTNDFYKFDKSVTVPYLLNKSSTPLRIIRPVDVESYKVKLELKGAKGHNLKNLDVIIPLNRLVTVTGVSGSGKSTLISKTLYPALARALDIEYIPSQEYAALEGVEHIKNVLLIDQSPIGKSARSSPITYLKAFDAIRTIMATVPEAKARGYTPGTFSLNVDGGRCPACKGTGYEEIDMMFMDNVVIPCDVCDSKKYRPEILEIQYKGKNVSEILAMTVSEAMNFFVAHPNIRKPLSVLKEVGLDYLALGQPANSLSGGESQRLKIAKELSQVHQKSTLYILDEPTTGLHFREVELLMRVLNKLIETGGSVVVVEHNLDVIRGSDYVIDLGPEAGKKGGTIVAQGSPDDIIKAKKSLTGQYLKRYVESHR
ncbi:excinuclease ABC subunit UvrA [Bdellovibrio svalbardensis]|uniref:UvrABC system protein A n=1 Tax=Bdellovibrio svalbardensis TaxID=2972972 RepID=A0ABT6DGW0_9BACT|nr:excinuclease ABC subunit UvrA [Bdellovibrio svalbardensis]MDG0815071.1 excinuclease ABC subunit UvrA [Bdellovibrio svalbardensis]